MVEKQRLFGHVMRAVVYSAFTVVVTALLVILVTHITRSPSNDRAWSKDQAVLATAEINDRFITIRHIRNFSYESESTYTAQYYDKTISLDELISVDYILEPLATFAVAHTFLSFGFTDGSHIAISVEIRKEQGETFSPLQGLMNTYELMYVIADEHDLLTLRAIHREDHLFLFPLTLSKEERESLFVHMLERANTLARLPQFYNTVENNCTTNIRDDINAIRNTKLPWDIRVVMPLTSDEYLYEEGLIENTFTFSELQERNRIDARVKQYANDPEFSRLIREVPTP